MPLVGRGFGALLDLRILTIEVDQNREQLEEAEGGGRLLGDKPWRRQPAHARDDDVLVGENGARRVRVWRMQICVMRDLIERKENCSRP